MAAIASIEVDLESEDTLKAILRGAVNSFVGHLKALPRVTEADGSQWIDAEKIDDMVMKLTSPIA